MADRAVPRGWLLVLLALCACGRALAAPPVLDYAPLPDSYSVGDCQTAQSVQSAVELDFGAGGNCTIGAPCDISVNASGGSGSFVDANILACSIAIGSGDGAIDVTPAPYSASFLGRYPPDVGTATIPVSCTPGSQDTVARLCCDEHQGGTTVRPFWDVRCPAPAANRPEFASNPAPGAVFALSTNLGTSTSTSLQVSNAGPGVLNVDPGGLAAPISIAPGAPQGIGSGGNLTFSIGCAPTQANTTQQMLVLSTNDADELALVYTIDCTGTQPPPPPAPVLAATPPPPGPLTLATTQPAQASTTFTIANTGSANLVVSSIDGVVAPFAVSPAAATIAPSQMQVFTVICGGATPGPFSAAISIANNAQSGVGYNLGCTVAPQPVPEFDSTPAAPGPLAIATTQGVSGSATLAVSNTGGATLHVTLATIGNDPSGKLSVAPPSATLGPGAGQDFIVGCNASAVGDFSGTLMLSTDDADEASVEYAVGCGVQSAPAPRYASVPAPFATLAMSSTQGSDAAATLSISNTGTATLAITPPIAALAAPFSVSPGTATIAPGASRNFVVTCSGASAGAFNNDSVPMRVSSNDPSQPELVYPLSCVIDAPVVPEYVSTPAGAATLAIATTVGTPGAATLNVRNTGNGTLQVIALTGLAAPLSVAPASASIAPGASANFFVSCSGAAAGAFGGTLRVSTNDADEAAVDYPVTCNVAALPPVFGSSPAALGPTIQIYTSVGVAASSTIQVSNTGPAGAGGLTLATSGLAPPLSIAPATIVAPGIARGASQALTLSCLPSIAGATTQTLSIASNDLTRSPALYTVRCAALAPEYDSTPVPGTTLVINAQRGSVATASVRVENPTLGAGTLQVGTSGLSGLLAVSPPSAAIPPPNLPPTLRYAPLATTTVTLAGGTASIGASSNLDGSGSGAAATTTLSGCAITGGGAGAFGPVVLDPNPPTFVGVAVGTGTIGLACTRAASSASATLSCNETRATNPPAARQWPLVCPAL